MKTQITERQKLMLVAAAMGQQVETAQATTIQVFDTLAVQAPQISVPSNYTFFEGCNLRALPDTNLSTNKLPYKNNMVVEYISISCYSDGNWLPYVWGTSFTLTIGNQKVLNKIAMLPYNQGLSNQILSIGGTSDNTLFVPRTKLVIPADTSFKLEINNLNTSDDAQVRVVIGGYGTIKGGTTY